jgi:hypothetical protein
MRLRMIFLAPMLLAIGLVSACQSRSPPMEPTSAGGDNASAPAQPATTPPPGTTAPAMPPASQEPQPPKQQ